MLQRFSVFVNPIYLGSKWSILTLVACVANGWLKQLYRFLFAVDKYRKIIWSYDAFHFGHACSFQQTTSVTIIFIQDMWNHKLPVNIIYIFFTTSSLFKISPKHSFMIDVRPQQIKVENSSQTIDSILRTAPLARIVSNNILILRSWWMKSGKLTSWRLGSVSPISYQGLDIGVSKKWWYPPFHTPSVDHFQ